MHSGEIRTATAPVIACAIEQGASAVVGEIAEHQDVVLERLERFQNPRQRAQAAFFSGIPSVHDDAVRNVDGRRPCADGLSSRCWRAAQETMASRNGSDTAKLPSPRKDLSARDNDFIFRLLDPFLNGTLWTIASISTCER